mmetsp:Transcript_39513/g.65171  ORF Transcript_39513/g.65171 Transcript_39513/m.65171 type:complete len:81 (-) Transcript_39513:233-475(-)
MPGRRRWTWPRFRPATADVRQCYLVSYKAVRGVNNQAVASLLGVLLVVPCAATYCKKHVHHCHNTQYNKKLTMFFGSFVT